MKQIKIIIFCFFQLFYLIIGDDCLSSLNNSTTKYCSEQNLTQLSLINSYLTEMPDLYNNSQLITLHLDNNQIQLINRNYSTVEYLYLTSNHIYALHLNNLSYPKLRLLDLSHNPIEHIIENFFSDKQFPRLEVLYLTNALKHINPYLIDNRLVSFSSLIYLNEILLNENNFEDFSCSKNLSFIQWKFSSNIKKISFDKNQLTIFDDICLTQISNLTELDLSANQFNFQNIKTKFLPSTLKNLSLNSIQSNLSCSIFENLIELEQLDLQNLSTTQLESCMFKNLPKLKMLNLRNHHLKTFDEKVFRPLLTMYQFHKLDITSSALLCESCSLRWVIELLKYHNKTEVTCLDQNGGEILIHTLNLSPCIPTHLFPTMMIIISLTISLLLSIMLCIYKCQHRKYSFTKLSSVYHMIPLRTYNRIYQSATDDITNDNVMLVT